MTTIMVRHCCRGLLGRKVSNWRSTQSRVRCAGQNLPSAAVALQCGSADA